MKEIAINCDKMEWENASGYPSGTKIKVLCDDKSGRTILLKLPKGFTMEAHCHVKTEQHFVLEGQYKSGEQLFGSQTYQLIPKGVTHGPFTSEKGATVLVIWNVS